MPPPPPPLILPLLLLLTSHTLAALYHPLQDCDETFNYWEPTHYLLHAHGFQTWEYSPAFALRSWAYIALHAVPLLPATLLHLPPPAAFYHLRLVLACVCAAAETRLFAALWAALHPRIALAYLLIAASAPGTFHASIAFLPSSFAMYAATLALAAFLQGRIAPAISALGIGALLGWPFAAALALPFILDAAARVHSRATALSLTHQLLTGSAPVLAVLAVQIAIDSAAYRRPVVVAWNIISYNVFPRPGRGPALYGSEPWHFYLRNLALNFHVWFALALASAPLVLLRVATAAGPARARHARALVGLAPFYLWLAVFSLQPHKEERFMYPAYPCLALNAAIAHHLLPFRRLATALLLPAALALSLYRTLGLTTAFHAPLTLYSHLPADPEPSLLCLAAEWHRFPSHFLLPRGVRAAFVRSAFAGLLPGTFGAGPWRAGTFGAAPGLNDANRADARMLVGRERCAWAVERRGETAEEAFGEDEAWGRVACERFLDAAASGWVGRVGWVPDAGWGRRVWGEYCLWRRRDTDGAV